MTQDDYGILADDLRVFLGLAEDLAHEHLGIGQVAKDRSGDDCMLVDLKVTDQLHALVRLCAEMATKLATTSVDDEMERPRDRRSDLMQAAE